LLAPLASESFANEAAKGTIHAPLTGAVGTTADLVPLTIAYNASNQSYTMTQGALSQTFTASDIDASQSDAFQTTYVVTIGSAQNVLSLIKTGTGTGQTRYVAAGIWQRQVNGPTAVDGTAYAFTYGVQTADVATPRTGSASFDVTLAGVRTWQTAIWAIGGIGTLNVDFTSGGMAGDGQFSEVALDSGIESGPYGWRAYGLIAGGTNSFAGIIDFDNIGRTEMQGSFYGPAAQELGGVWWIDGDDSASVGAFFGGRGTYPVNQATKLAFPEHDLFFKPLATSVTAGINGSGILSTPGAGTPLSSVYIQEDRDSPIFYRTGPQIFNGGAGQSYEYYPLLLTYMRAGQMLNRVGSTATLDSFLFGFDTASADMPKTGSAHYSLALRAGLLASGKELQTVRGYGDMLAKFASGAIEVDGTYSIYTFLPASGLGDGTPSGPANDTGIWSGTGTIAGNGFSGNLLLDGTTDYTGTMQGRFYGSNADEVGAVFRLTGGTSQVGGTLGGALSDTPYGGNSTLAGLTDTTDLTGGGRGTFINNINNHFTAESNTVKITYNPQTKTYAFDTVYNAGNSELDFVDTLGTANVDNSASDPGFVHYVKGGVAGRILQPGPGNPVINLSYASFAHIAAPMIQHNAPNNIEQFFHFGLATAPDRVPTTGSANYSGVVFGRGAYTADWVPFAVGGTSSLNYDFGNGDFTATLNLKIQGGANTNLGSFTFAGDPQSPFGNYFFAYNSDNSFRGNLNGNFYGPNAEEFGASWEVNMPNQECCGDAALLYGITVGAKN
jgi:hypothetical protein